MEPQVDAVQDCGVDGLDGADAGVDEFDMPPPQAVSAVIARTQAAEESQVRGFAHARVACWEQCIEISSLCLVLLMSAGEEGGGYRQKRRGAATEVPSATEPRTRGLRAANI